MRSVSLAAIFFILLALQSIATAAEDSPSPASSASAPAAPLFHDGFEGPLNSQWRFGINGDSDPLRQKGDAQAIAQAGLIRIVDAPARAGAHAVRFEVPRRLGSFRSELALGSVLLDSD